MAQSKRNVKLKMGKDRKWPPFCVMCMREATTQDVDLINGDHAPYCETCLLKVKRLRNWKDTIFAIALIIGGIFAISGMVYFVRADRWRCICRIKGRATASPTSATICDCVNLKAMV